MDYYILKFGDKSRSSAELEQTYYEMALAAGINMMESRLLEVDGVNHFLTRLHHPGCCRSIEAFPFGSDKIRRVRTMDRKS